MGLDSPSIFYEIGLLFDPVIRRSNKFSLELANMLVSTAIKNRGLF